MLSQRWAVTALFFCRLVKDQWGNAMVDSSRTPSNHGTPLEWIHATNELPKSCCSPSRRRTSKRASRPRALSRTKPFPQTKDKMSLSSRCAAQCCVRQLRSPRSLRASAMLLTSKSPLNRRHNSTEAPANPKIAAIVDQISHLTLLETADLVSSLKVRWYTAINRILTTDNYPSVSA